MEPYIGQIQCFAFNFAPKGWAFCNGQLLSIAQNQALFALITTTYGGDGITTFALPNLQGRAPIHFGQGPGLSYYSLGEMTGTEQVTLLQSQMPSHTHPMMVSTTAGNTNSPAGQVLAVAVDGNETNVNSYGSQITGTASPQAIGASGSNSPVSIMQPVLVMNYCIATEGIYPSRS